MRAESSAIRSWCEKCGSLLGAALRPCLLHEANAVYGFVDPTNCAVLDVPRTGLGRADAVGALTSLRGALEGAGREPVVSRIRRRKTSRREGRVRGTGVPQTRGGLGV